MNAEQERLINELDAALSAAATAYTSLIELERVTPGIVPLAPRFHVPTAGQITNWRAHVSAVRAGERAA